MREEEEHSDFSDVVFFLILMPIVVCLMVIDAIKRINGVRLWRR